MKNLRNQKGQGTVEMVLLMAIGVGLSLMVTNYLQENQFAQKLFGNPWNRLSGMIECGVWTGCASDKAHPASSSRILSLKPDE